MNVKYFIKKVDGLVVPKRANETDAGYDVVATSDPRIVGTTITTGNETLYSRIDYIEFDTNLYMVPDSHKLVELYRRDMVHFSEDIADVTTGQRFFHTDIRPRSSISKYNLVLANSIGLIDRGYQDQIKFRFKYIAQPSDLRIISLTGRGAIAVAVDMERVYKRGDRIGQVLPMLTSHMEIELVDSLPGDNRGGGFGHTGK